MVSDNFCVYVLSLFKQTTTCWAQLHSENPGMEGVDGVCTDSRRLEVHWAPAETGALVSDRAIIWNQFQGITGFPQTVEFITLWSEPQNGILWATLRIPPIRIPHMATLEIPAGLEVRLVVPAANMT